MRSSRLIFAASLLSVFFILFASAHPGGTDSDGGHYNRSTGEYHYHHGYSAHSHDGGVCPYDYEDITPDTSSDTEQSTLDELMAIARKQRETGDIYTSRQDHVSSGSHTSSSGSSSSSVRPPEELIEQRENIDVSVEVDKVVPQTIKPSVDTEKETTDSSLKSESSSSFWDEFCNVCSFIFDVLCIIFLVSFLLYFLYLIISLFVFYVSNLISKVVYFLDIFSSKLLSWFCCLSDAVKLTLYIILFFLCFLSLIFLYPADIEVVS